LKSVKAYPPVTAYCRRVTVNFDPSGIIIMNPH
jgi:hypothetical protein